jgi:hypothetical protein
LGVILPSRWRTVKDTRSYEQVYIALLIAPLAVPLLLIPYVSSMDLALEIGVVIAYGGSITFGLPVYWFLRRHNWTMFWIAPGLGFILGAPMWLAFGVMFALALGEGMAGVQLALTDANMLKGMFWPGGILGAVAGTLFWLIARPDRRST